MNAELTVMLTVSGRPLWVKKKTVGGELTKPLGDREYDQIVDRAVSELEELVLSGITATKPVATASKAKTSRK